MVWAELWQWRAEETRTERMSIYRELLEVVYRKSPDWLKLTPKVQLRFRIMLHPEHDQLFGVDKNVESDGQKINSVLYSRGKVHTAILHGAYLQDLLVRLRCTMLHVMIPACICRTMSSSRKGWAPTCWQRMSPSRKE